MKTFIALLLVTFVMGCSSAPTVNETPESSEQSEDLPKAVPRQSIKEKVYAPQAIKGVPAEESTEPVGEGKSCETPLGTIPDRGKATGFLQEEVGPNEVCISDAIRCKNGEWKGDAIHKKCVKRKK